MGDFKIKLVTGVIPSLATTFDVNAPTGFDVISNLNYATMIPACAGKPQSGIGRSGGTFNNALANLNGYPIIVDTDTISYNDNSSLALNNLNSAWLLEYVGPVGGVNEVKLVAVKTISLLSGVLTADSTPITGFANINRCVPFSFVAGNPNSAEYRAVYPDIQIIASGADQVVRVTRVGSSFGDIVVQVFVTEFTGANWGVQTGTHTFSSSNTDEDVTISSVGSVAQAFVYSVFRPTSANVPATQTYYAYLSSVTNLRTRVQQLAGAGGQVMRYWVINNSQLKVTRYGTPDGVADLTGAGGNIVETKDVTITAVNGVGQSMALGYAGSDNTGTATVAGASEWLMWLTTTTNVRLQRSNSLGNTEYVIQVLEFDNMESTRIDAISPIVVGQPVTINGLFTGTSATVRMRNEDGTLSQSQTVTGFSGSSVTVGAWVRGPFKFGVLYTIEVVANGASDAIDAAVFPEAGRNFINVVDPMAPVTARLVGQPDIEAGDQLSWFNVLGTAVTVADVTVYGNGGFEAAADLPTKEVTSFQYEINDGLDWSIAPATQLIQSPVVEPPPPDPGIINICIGNCSS